tara:strand:+ start:345 stop:677 length:333 start_codon:yes stop_codon:yes gene_type:complete
MYALFAALALAQARSAQALSDGAPTTPKLPAWTWDHVSTYMHCANRTGALWSAGAVENMSKSAFVVFEKNHGLFDHPKYTGAEEKISKACGQVDARRGAPRASARQTRRT